MAHVYVSDSNLVLKVQSSLSPLYLLLSSTAVRNLALTNGHPFIFLSNPRIIYGDFRIVNLYPSKKQAYQL